MRFPTREVTAALLGVVLSVLSFVLSLPFGFFWFYPGLLMTYLGLPTGEGWDGLMWDFSYSAAFWWLLFFVVSYIFLAPRARNRARVEPGH